jgi:predicted RNase H-like nuclease (RuvC/YqgF family)
MLFDIEGDKITMADELRKLGTMLLDASTVAQENKQLQQEMTKLRATINRDEQRRIISELKTRIREDQRLIETLTAKNKRLKHKAGLHKHKADMLEVQLEKLMKKVKAINLVNPPPQNISEESP